MKMFKTQCSFLVLLSTLVSVCAVPAIVWEKSSAATGPIHSSALLEASSLVSAGSEKKQVVFVLGRDESGNEGLTALTTSNSIPKVAERYAEASVVHHYVRGMESVDSLVSQTNAQRRSLLEFNSGAADEKTSDVTVVNLASASPTEIDAAVSAALNDASVDTVVLTSVRGVSEVKLERDVASRKNLHDQMKQSVANVKVKAMQKTSNQQNRRRLEDRGKDNENGDGSTDGIYFVNFTPNIFSGLLFFGFFISITFVGFGCLNMIVGQQDNYVSKYPAIGKEV
jgi:hypothetical protein